MSDEEELVSLGFDRYWVQQSMALTGGNKEFAIEWLLSDEFKRAKSQFEQSQAAARAKQAASPRIAQQPKQEEPASVQPAFSVEDILGADTSSDTSDSDSDDLEEIRRAAGSVSQPPGIESYPSVGMVALDEADFENKMLAEMKRTESQLGDVGDDDDNDDNKPVSEEKPKAKPESDSDDGAFADDLISDLLGDDAVPSLASAPADAPPAMDPDRQPARNRVESVAQRESNAVLAQQIAVGWVCHACGAQMAADSMDEKCLKCGTIKPSASDWVCQVCSFVNDETDTICSMCLSTKPNFEIKMNIQSSGGKQKLEIKSEATWTCESCLYVNPEDSQECRLCGLKPDLEPAPVSSRQPAGASAPVSAPPDDSGQMIANAATILPGDLNPMANAESIPVDHNFFEASAPGLEEASAPLIDMIAEDEPSAPGALENALMGGPILAAAAPMKPQEVAEKSQGGEIAMAAAVAGASAALADLDLPEPPSKKPMVEDKFSKPKAGKMVGGSEEVMLVRKKKKKQEKQVDTDEDSDEEHKEAFKKQHHKRKSIVGGIADASVDEQDESDIPYRDPAWAQAMSGSSQAFRSASIRQLEAVVPTEVHVEPPEMDEANFDFDIPEMDLQHLRAVSQRDDLVPKSVLYGLQGDPTMLAIPSADRMDQPDQKDEGPQLAEEQASAPPVSAPLMSPEHKQDMASAPPIHQPAPQQAVHNQQDDIYNDAFGTMVVGKDGNIPQAPPQQMQQQQQQAMAGKQTHEPLPSMSGATRIKLKLRIGTTVEVFSASNQKWTEGRIDKIKGDLICVVYGKKMKWMKKDSRQLRPKSEHVTQALSQFGQYADAHTLAQNQMQPSLYDPPQQQQHQQQHMYNPAAHNPYSANAPPMNEAPAAAFDAPAAFDLGAMQKSFLDASAPPMNDPLIGVNSSAPYIQTPNKQKPMPPPQPPPPQQMYDRKRAAKQQKRHDNGKYVPPRSGPAPAGAQNQDLADPKQDEFDYDVTFTQSVLGMELYPDEHGNNCIVSRCLSATAKQNVDPTSMIIKINDVWVAGWTYDMVRDAVKQAARNPPLNIGFRVKMNKIGAKGGGNNNQRGYLKIKVVAAIHLKKRANYCIVQVGSARLSTHEVPHDEHPEWQEMLTFKNYRPDASKTGLVEVFGTRTALKDKKIGAANFKLPTKFNEIQRDSLELKSSKGKLAGVLVINSIIVDRTNSVRHLRGF